MLCVSTHCGPRLAARERTVHSHSHPLIPRAPGVRGSGAPGLLDPDFANPPSAPIRSSESRLEARLPTPDSRARPSIEGPWSVTDSKALSLLPRETSVGRPTAGGLTCAAHGHMGIWAYGSRPTSLTMTMTQRPTSYGIGLAESVSLSLARLGCDGDFFERTDGARSVGWLVGWSVGRLVILGTLSDIHGLGERAW